MEVGALQPPFAHADRSVRVLHVLSSMDYGGIETWLMQVVKHVDRTAFKVDFCCLSGAFGVFEAELLAQGCVLHSCALRAGLRSFNSRLAGLLRDGRYDVVHSHVHLFSGYVLWRAARAGVTGRVAHSFTAPPRRLRSPARWVYERAMSRLIHRYATVGLGNSRASMVSLFGPRWTSDRRLQLLYCGIDTSRFLGALDCAATLARFGIPGDATVIGHVGRLVPPKNHRFFIDVAEELSHSYRDIWFLALGDGPLGESLRGEVARRGLTRVVFAGRVSDEEVAAALRSMRLLLFPSLWEGLPQTVIEAQAAGLPCLCSENVTREVEVVPGAVRFLPLGAGPIGWGTECLKWFERYPQDREAWCKRVALSPFGIEESTASLCKVYTDAATGPRTGVS